MSNGKISKVSENTVSQEKINRIIGASEVQVETFFDKCTVVTVKLPNGFILTESSACVDPANYDRALGLKICMERIENKVWELEGYLMQQVTHAERVGKKLLELGVDVKLDTFGWATIVDEHNNK